MSGVGWRSWLTLISRHSLVAFTVWIWESDPCGGNIGHSGACWGLISLAATSQGRDLMHLWAIWTLLLLGYGVGGVLHLRFSLHLHCPYSSPWADPRLERDLLPWRKLGYFTSIVLSPPNNFCPPLLPPPMHTHIQTEPPINISKCFQILVGLPLFGKD